MGAFHTVSAIGVAAMATGKDIMKPAAASLAQQASAVVIFILQGGLFQAPDVKKLLK